MQFLEKWPECRLTALYVIVPMTLPADTLVPVRLEHEERELAERLKGEMAERFEAFAPRMQYRVERGLAADEIVRVAEEVQADLIIVGSHGKKAVDRLFMGSVSTAVVHRAKQPVLVVR